VKDVTISGMDVHGTYNDNAPFHTLIPANYPEIYKTLEDSGVPTIIKEPNASNWVSLLINAVPFILLLGFWIFMMRQMQSGGNKALSFGKSRARLHSSQQKKVTFKDVAGVEEAKEEPAGNHRVSAGAAEVPEAGRADSEGRAADRPPGTGKTLLARAIAGRGQRSVFLYLRIGLCRDVRWGRRQPRARPVRAGQKNAPCIVFIDEIDAVGRHRGAGLGGGHDEREQTLNQLLVEMDGFESNEGVILVRRPTARMFSIRRCCGPAGSTGAWWWGART